MKLIAYCFSAVSYNQPTFYPDTSWNPNGITVANSSTIGSYPYGIFINTNNTIFVPNQDNGKIIVWPEGNLTSTRIISGNLSNSSSLFVTTASEIYIDAFHSIGGVAKIIFNSTIGIWLWPAIGHLRIRRFDFFFFIQAMFKSTRLDAVFRADYESDLKNKLKLNFHSESSTFQHFQLLILLFRLSNPFKKILKTLLSDRESNSLQYSIFLFMFE